MTNGIDSNRAVVGSMLAGGAIGATLGAMTAPNAVGKVDVDRVFNKTPYTNIIKDRIAKLGEASMDLFIREENNYENEMDTIGNHVYNIIGDENKTITGKELKELVAEYDTIANEPYNKPTRLCAANKYRKAIMSLDDESVFNKEALKDLMVKNSEKLKDAKKTLKEYLSLLPKQRGKYAAIFGTVCTLVAGALTYILIPSNNNKKA